MNETSIEKPVWQLGGGSSDRNFANLLITNGVGLLGPGDMGTWTSTNTAYAKENSLRQFVQEVRCGDLVLLRQGRLKVLAVGIIAGDYDYFNQFEDVEGWDLQHGRRVRWFQLPDAYEFPKPVFGSSPSRFSRV
jgi:hypothetical protein